jgi:hypothetical protein
LDGFAGSFRPENGTVGELIKQIAAERFNLAPNPLLNADWYRLPHCPSSRQVAMPTASGRQSHA